MIRIHRYAFVTVTDYGQHFTHRDLQATETCIVSLTVAKQYIYIYLTVFFSFNSVQILFRQRTATKISDLRVCIIPVYSILYAVPCYKILSTKAKTLINSRYLHLG